MSLAAPALAIEIADDGGASWANNPDCVAHPALCHPAIIGSPRVVTDMRDVADFLLFTLDFDEVAVSDFLGPSTITLNIADVNGNAILVGGTELKLTYTVPLSDPNPSGSGLLPATDFTTNLSTFTNFGLLPAGDLLFTTTLRLHLDLPFGNTFGSGSTLDRAATLIISGPGTVVSVPEPSTWLLSLAGLAALGLAAPRLRRSERQ